MLCINNFNIASLKWYLNTYSKNQTVIPSVKLVKIETKIFEYFFSFGGLP